MGRAIDALHDALVQIENDGGLFLDEEFMQNIFSEIASDIPELEEHMTHILESKQTNTMNEDGSKVLPFDQLNAELFHPSRE